MTIRKPITLNGYGAIIDGRDTAGNLVRSTWLSVAANDVTVRGFTMRYANGTYATGSVENAVGVQRFRLEDCDLGFSYVNLNLTGAIDSTIKNCAIHDAKHLGVRVSAPGVNNNRGQRNQVIGNRIYRNNIVGEPDNNGDAAGIKITAQDNFVISGNEVYDNGANGLWQDAWCRNSMISNNRVHGNNGPGIFDETSTGTKISGNVSWRNGANEPWGWGAGILVAASKGTEVYNNTLAWNRIGISYISQNRGDDPGMTGNYSHDNFVAEAQQVAGQDHWGSFWAQDWNGILYLPSSNNHGLNDRFYYANPDGSLAPENQYLRFIWDGYRSATTFRTTPGGQGASYATQADATAILTAAGVPSTP